MIVVVDFEDGEHEAVDDHFIIGSDGDDGGAFVIDEDVHDEVFIGIVYDYEVFIGIVYDYDVFIGIVYDYDVFIGIVYDYDVVIGIVYDYDVVIGIVYDYDVFIGDDDDDVKLQRLHCTCAELTNRR